MDLLNRFVGISSWILSKATHRHGRFHQHVCCPPRALQVESARRRRAQPSSHHFKQPLFDLYRHQKLSPINEDTGSPCSAPTRHYKMSQKPPSTTTRPRSNFLLNTGSFQRQSRPGPGGIPTYIWVTAGGTFAMLSYCYFANINEVPLTHRRRWIATSPEYEKQMGDMEYRQLLAQFRKQGTILPPSHPAYRTVHRVGSRIADASYEFAANYNLNHYAKTPFTYTVVRSDQANAFVLPGNHIFVLTGLFKYAQTEEELASVLGHEVSHVLARHAGEKISGGIVVSTLARLSLLFDPTGLLATIFLPAAALFRELPNNRTQETEADQIGVHLMAAACFDPRASPRVFKRMDQDQHGIAPPEFLSTHPANETRIDNLNKFIPSAVREYQDNDKCRFLKYHMEELRSRNAT